MASGSPAPDLFAALEWSASVAPAAPPAIVDDLGVDDAPASLTSAGLERPVGRPQRLPPLAAPASADAALDATPGQSFGGLADALEPPSEASPVLDEFEGLLDIFEPAAAAAPAAVAPDASPMPRPKPVGVVRPRLPAAAAARRPTPVLGTMPRPRTVVEASPPSIDFPAPGDAAASAQLAALDEPTSAMLSRVAPRIDDEPAPRRGLPALWIALTLMLGGALTYVLATQTDLFSGNVIEKRNAQAQAEAEAEAAQAKLDAKRVEYGTIEIDSEPKAARVFEMRDGPEALFEHLPTDHEYMVLATAPGFAPRIRLVKGSELAAPVIVDLDALADGQPMPAIGEERVPKLAQPPSKLESTLSLRSNTPGAQLGLLIGYTPGVKVVDVDVQQTHRYHVVSTGYRTHEIVVKGRHFEESSPGVLAFQEVVKLEPLPPVAPVDDDASGQDDVVVVDEDAPAPASAPVTKAAAKKSKKKKKKKSR